MAMSDFAFFRFMSGSLLTRDEEELKDEIVGITEEVLHAEGLRCGATIAKISEYELKEILGKIRKLRKRRKKASDDAKEVLVVSTEEQEEEKRQYDNNDDDAQKKEEDARVIQ